MTKGLLYVSLIGLPTNEGLQRARTSQGIIAKFSVLLVC